MCLHNKTKYAKLHKITEKLSLVFNKFPQNVSLSKRTFFDIVLVSLVIVCE